MIHIIKNYKWVLTTSLISIAFGLMTFLTFINQSFIPLNNLNIQILLLVDLTLLALFFIIIITKTYKILLERKNKKLGSQTSLRYILFFSTTTLLPSLLIAIFSLFLFNVVLQKYFDKKIKTVVNNSSEVASNYLEQTRNSIEADILLMLIDINNKSKLFYENPKKFSTVLATQRLLRRLDEVHLIDSAGNIIMSNIINPNLLFVPPPEDAFVRSLDGKPIRITDTRSNRTSALVKLNNFIDTYLYIVKFLDPKVINYLIQSNEAVTFYYSVQENKTGLKITFVVIYLLIVSLLLFLSIIISINFANKLTIPIVNLINASDKISSGDLSTKVPHFDSGNEFEILNKNFNSMINQLKTQQEKLLISERHEAWENLARKLAHEIKNPLTPIQLTIDRLKSKYSEKIVDHEKEDFSKSLLIIGKQIKQIENLVNEFSDFARMPKPILKDNNLVSLIKDNIKLINELDNKIIIDFKSSKSDILLNSDSEQLSRAFFNLIKNSIESIQEKKIDNLDMIGKIDIFLNEDVEKINFMIIDNGLGFGIFADNIENILNPYFTTKKNGTGLGLSIVNKIINDHNGKINFISLENGAKIEIIFTK